MNAINIENLIFGYPGGPDILAIRELQIKAGSRVFLHGKSGSGKSTLLSVLAGILPTPPGAVRILEQDMGKLSASHRVLFRARHIGYIFQQFNLIPYLTVAENIALPARFGRLADRDFELETEVHRLANNLGIASVLGNRAADISVGQAQRAAAARAVIGNPEIILADEPTSALDSDAKEGFLDLLFQAVNSRGGTLIFVSHDSGLKRLFHQTIELTEINQTVSSPPGGQA